MVVGVLAGVVVVVVAQPAAAVVRRPGVVHRAWAAGRGRRVARDVPKRLRRGDAGKRRGMVVTTMGGLVTMLSEALW